MVDTAIFHLCLLLTLQAGVRQHVQGGVTDRGGAPVAGAEVTLIARPVHGMTIGDLDRVRARTNERGRFRADLLPARGYSAWATWKDAEGNAHATEIVDDVLAGKPLKLVEKDELAPRRLRVTGLAAWNIDGPARLSIRYPAKTRWEQELVRAEDGTFSLPVVPVRNGSTRLRVLAPDGRLLQEFAHSLARKPDRPVTTVRLRAPATMQVRVRTADGTPVEGARVQVRWRNGVNWLVGGETAKDGTCKVHVRPPYVRRPQACIRVAKKGYADAFGGWRRRGDAYINGKELASRPDVFDFVLEEASPLEGRIVDAGGEPAAGVHVVVSYQTRVGTPTRWRSEQGALLSVVTDARGVYRLAHVPSYACSIELRFVPTAEHLRALLGADALAFPPLLTPFPVFDARPDRLADIRLSDFVPVRLRLVTADGRAARALLVRILQSAGDSFRDAGPLGFTDKQGRVRLLCRSGENTLFAWGPDAGYVIEELPRSAELLTRKLRPFRTITGVVVDEDGKPAPKTRIYSTGGQGGRSPYGDQIDAINHRLIPTAADDAGRFTVRFVEKSNWTYELLFVRTAGTDTRSASFRLQRPEKDLRIVLRKK